LPSVEMKANEFSRGLEEACNKLGVTTHVTVVGIRGDPAQAEIRMQFTGDKVSATVKTEAGKLYEIWLEVTER
jgi:hypothetical protein